MNPLALENQLCFPIYAASRLTQRLYRPLLLELGLSYPQYLTMLVLWEEDGLSVGAIGDRLHLDSGTLTPLLKRLETRGLIERHRDAPDERVVRVFLTEEGRALRSDAEGIPAKLACQLDLQMDEAMALHRTLHALLDRLQDAQT